MTKEQEQTYLDKMSQTLKEKLFWIPIIPCSHNVVVDFGCADGTLLAYLESDANHIYHCLGIDTNEAFLEIAKEKTRHSIFSTSLDTDASKNFLGEFSTSNGCINGCIFNFSSILHELFTFCTKEEIDNILTSACNIAEYITIRDMLRPSMYLTQSTTAKNKPVPFQYKVLDNSGEVFKRWIELHPTTENAMDDYIQYKMKCMYKNNLDKEIREDYFSVDWEYLDKFFKDHGYELMYKNDYANQFICNQIDEQNILTHRTLVYRKTGKKWNVQNS